jgi:hypothetical protein
MARGERSENHPSRKVDRESRTNTPTPDRTDAIIDDLQAMLEGRMAPKRSITQLGLPKK